MVFSAYISAHALAFGQYMTLYGLEQLSLSNIAFLSCFLPECIELEKIMMRRPSGLGWLPNQAPSESGKQILVAGKHSNIAGHNVFDRGQPSPNPDNVY